MAYILKRGNETLQVKSYQIAWDIKQLRKSREIKFPSKHLGADPGIVACTYAKKADTLCTEIDWQHVDHVLWSVSATVLENNFDKPIS